MTLSDRIEALATELYGAPHQWMTLLCNAAENHLQALLRDDVSPESLGDNYICAAALLANAALTAVDTNVTSMDAGTLSLTFDDKNNRLIQLADRLVAPWCKDRTVFLGVRA